MFCPQCGTTQPDEMNYCKSCGAHLQAVRTALERPGSVEELKLEKTWLGQALMTQDEKDRIRGITPEMKRRREIKAGVITASAGVALTVALFVLMEGIILSGRVTDATALLSRLWIVGLIPILVGGALIVNGAFISPRSKDKSDQIDPATNTAPDELVSPAETNLLPDTPFSVTDETTRHLNEPVLVERMKTK